MEDWGAYTEAFLGWGIMESRRGRREEARTRFERAWKAAKRGGHRELQAAARHNLLVVVTTENDLQDAYAHAKAAWRLYDNDSTYISRLANDIARLWAQHDYYLAALPIFRLLLDLPLSPTDRTQVLANVARSSAALGRKKDFMKAIRLMEEEFSETMYLAVPSLIHAAEGARTLLHMGKAFDLASRAVRIAQRQGGEEQIRMAEELLESIQNGELRFDVHRSPPLTVRRFTRKILARLKRQSCKSTRLSQ